MFYLIIFSISFLLVPHLSGAQEHLTVHMLDVGYGDAYVIEAPNNEIIMIDSGPQSSSLNVINYLKQLGVKGIHTAFITHPHQNHFDGFKAIAEHFPIKRAFTNGDLNTDHGFQKLINTFKEKGIPLENVQRGNRLNDFSSGITFEIFHPKDLNGSVNSNSLVILLTYKNFKMVFFSDIEASIQNELIREGVLKSVGYITIPHHGAQISEKFIRFARDKTCFLSTGPNSWGINFENSQEIKGPLYRTDAHGTVTIRTDGIKVNIYKP